MLIVFGIIAILAIGTILNIIFAVEEPDDDIREENSSFNENKTLIRANQGHSIPVDVELEQKIRESLEKRGIEVYKIKVNIEGEETQVKLTLKTEISQEERKELKDALVEEWGLKENRICIQTV